MDEGLTELKGIKDYINNNKVDTFMILEYIDSRIRHRISNEPTEEEMYFELEGHTFSRESGKCVDKK